MAISAYALDNAEWTFTTADGAVMNGWAFVRLGDPAEDRKYVVPVAGASMVAANGSAPGRIKPLEYMPNLPFPLESSRPARTSGGGVDNIPGAWALHFFGGI